jgi:hypothetical protein
VVAALAATLVLATPAQAVELSGSCYGWNTVGSKIIGSYVYSVQARSCVEMSSTTGAIRAHTGVRFLKSGSATTAFRYGRFNNVRLYMTVSNPQLASDFNDAIGDVGGVSPGSTISGYSYWRCGEPHEFWTGSSFDYQYPDGEWVFDKSHASNGVNVNPEC